MSDKYQNNAPAILLMMRIDTVRMQRLGRASMHKRFLAFLFASIGAFWSTTVLAQYTIPMSSFFSDDVCKATIAKMMGRDPRIIQLDRIENDVHFLSYRRPDDNSYWGYRCRLEGNRVIWASDTGRWRTNPRDEIFTFAAEGEERIVITEKSYNGQTGSKTFVLKDLRRD